MQNPNHIIMRYSAMTGIRDPKVDAWVGNQELYKKHGMAHPAVKKVEPERRSRSPMLLPGPRKVKGFEKEALIRFHFMDGHYVIEDMFPGIFDLIDKRLDGWWVPAAREIRKVENPRGIGTMSGISPWTHPSRIPKEAWSLIPRLEVSKGGEDEDKRRSGRPFRIFPPEA